MMILRQANSERSRATRLIDTPITSTDCNSVNGTIRFTIGPVGSREDEPYHYTLELTPAEARKMAESLLYMAHSIVE